MKLRSPFDSRDQIKVIAAGAANSNRAKESSGLGTEKINGLIANISSNFFVLNLFGKLFQLLSSHLSHLCENAIGGGLANIRINAGIRGEASAQSKSLCNHVGSHLLVLSGNSRYVFPVFSIPSVYIEFHFRLPSPRYKYRIAHYVEKVQLKINNVYKHILFIGSNMKEMVLSERLLLKKQPQAN